MLRTLRWGDLLEVLIYDCGRYLTLKGPHAGLVRRRPSAGWPPERRTPACAT
jgi:hypothetical protein